MRQDRMRGVPRDLNDMRHYLMMVFELRGAVQGVTTNPSTNALKVNCRPGVVLDDVYMPITRGKLNDATAILQRIVSGIGQGFMPSDSDAMQLFDLIDQQAG